MAAEMQASRQELKDAQVDLAFRDNCAHILIPLNECRRQTYYAPWKCTDLRHSHEKCEYEEYLFRCRELIRQQGPGKRVADWQKPTTQADTE